MVAIRATDGALRAPIPALAKAVITGKARLGHVSGARGALVAPDGPRLLDTPEFPAAYQVEAIPYSSILDRLRSEFSAGFDWFSITPSADYLESKRGQALGRYRKGGD